MLAQLLSDPAYVELFYTKCPDYLTNLLNPHLTFPNLQPIPPIKKTIPIWTQLTPMPIKSIGRNVCF